MDWEFSLPLVLVYPCDLQELVYFVVKVSIDQSCGWEKLFVTGGWLEQLLVPSFSSGCTDRVIPQDPTREYRATSRILKSLFKDGNQSVVILKSR